MTLQERYEPADKDVVSEEIDGEVIIVNLKNGNYYSLTQSAAVVWAGIERGDTIEQLQNRLSSRYSGESEVMNQALEELVRALAAERLIAHRSSSKSDESTEAASADDLPVQDRGAFQPPGFERFTDMEDLLLLDPVHETEDEKGWPHAKANA